MHDVRKLVFPLVLALALVCVSALAAAAPLPGFTAHYRVLRNGSPIGKATLTLVADNDGVWTFTTTSKGTSGLASMLGASTREVSTFRWVDDLPQGLSYDYKLKMAFKNKHRHVAFDWDNRTIAVNDDGEHHFATQPGALERHTVPLAIAAALATGDQTFNLAVAVRDRIETQHYAVQGTQSLDVPAGNFDTTRVSRTDGHDSFEAWFAPGKLPAPVKIDQRGKNDYSLELVDWSGQPST